MNQTQNSKPLNISLWIAQFILAAMLIMAGMMKATTPIAELAQKMDWADDMPELFIRFIGISECLGALGLILPSLLRIKPNLTPLAAYGIVLIMLCAAIFHITRSEFSAIAFNSILGGIAAFIGWGRSKKVVILPKN